MDPKRKMNVQVLLQDALDRMQGVDSMPRPEEAEPLLRQAFAEIREHEDPGEVEVLDLLIQVTGVCAALAPKRDSAAIPLFCEMAARKARLLLP